jgi:hypothetical protein
MITSSYLLYYGVTLAHFCFLAAVFEIKLGTVDQSDIDVEWRLRPFMNTAKKRLALSTDSTH